MIYFLFSAAIGWSGKSWFESSIWQRTDSMNSGDFFYYVTFEVFLCLGSSNKFIVPKYCDCFHSNSHSKKNNLFIYYYQGRTYGGCGGCEVKIKSLVSKPEVCLQAISSRSWTKSPKTAYHSHVEALEAEWQVVQCFSWFTNLFFLKDFSGRWPVFSLFFLLFKFSALVSLKIDWHPPEKCCMYAPHYW